MERQSITNQFLHGQDLLEHSPDGIFMIDHNLQIKYANSAFCHLLGYTMEELLGSTILDHLGDLSILTTCMETVAKEGRCVDQETIFRRKDGSIVHISKSVQAIFNDAGDVINTVVFIRDMSSLHALNTQLSHSQKQLQEYVSNLEVIVDERTKELSEQLYTDVLTRLPNRSKLLVDLTEGLQGKVLILLNIDGFKEINSYFGQDVGDAILAQVAEELVAFLNELQMGIVYKLPSDEYAIVIQENLTHTNVESIVKLISKQIGSRSFRTKHDQEISLDVTIGISMLSEMEDTGEEILSLADMAQKQAKKERKPYLFYTSAMQIKEAYEYNLGWIKRLKKAIDNDAIIPYFQPIVDAATRKIVKYEALVRIREGDEIILPGHFLEIAKKVKLYPQITQKMIEKTFDLFAGLTQSVSINLSIEDIVNEEMNAFVLKKIRTCGFAERIIFEITESEGIGNYDQVNTFIQEVKRCGGKIALDDFGSGYSNFVYVTQLNVDFIKIDGSIILQIEHNKSAQVIVQTIADFASKLGIQTIAEFVSDERILKSLQAYAIDAYQGYYFGIPSPEVKG